MQVVADHIVFEVQVSQVQRHGVFGRFRLQEFRLRHSHGLDVRSEGDPARLVLEKAGDEAEVFFWNLLDLFQSYTKGDGK